MGNNYGYRIGLIGFDIHNRGIRVNYNMSMRSHAATIHVDYDKQAESALIHMKLIGEARDRWDIIAIFVQVASGAGSIPLAKDEVPGPEGYAFTLQCNEVAATQGLFQAIRLIDKCAEENSVTIIDILSNMNRYYYNNDLICFYNCLFKKMIFDSSFVSKIKLGNEQIQDLVHNAREKLGDQVRLLASDFIDSSRMNDGLNWNGDDIETTRCLIKTDLVTEEDRRTIEDSLKKFSPSYLATPL